MSGLNISDRVELITEIRHSYRSSIGIITAADEHAIPALREFVVRLADGTEATLSGFQLRTVPATSARAISDSTQSRHTSGTRGSPKDQHLRFANDDFDIHIKVSTSTKHKKVFGQVISSTTVWELALVTLFGETQLPETVTTDRFGEFTFQDVRAGRMGIEIFVPSHRVIATFDV
jgi:hypothetical protein